MTTPSGHERSGMDSSGMESSGTESIAEDPSVGRPPICEQPVGEARLLGGGAGRTSMTRRGLLGVGAVATVGLVATACASAPPEPKSEQRNREIGRKVTATDEDELAVVTTAAKLEYLAADTYRKSHEALDAGTVGPVPAAVAHYVRVAHDQHQAAEDRWNRVRTDSHHEAVNEPPEGLPDKVENMFSAAKRWQDLAELALLVEQTVADTYLEALPSLRSKDLIALAGSLQVIDQQHQATLYFVLGRYPVPDVFQQTDYAYRG